MLPEADVTTYRPLVNDLKLPDPGDRHVLAAAIAGRAPVIVTWNLKDFPPQDLQPYGVTSQSPDDFLSDLHVAFSEALIASVKNARHNLRKTVPSVDAFVEALELNGLKRFSAILRRNSSKLK